METEPQQPRVTIIMVAVVFLGILSAAAFGLFGIQPPVNESEIVITAEKPSRLPVPVPPPPPLSPPLSLPPIIPPPPITPPLLLPPPPKIKFATTIKEALEDKKNLESFLKSTGVKVAMDRLVTESGGGSVYDCHQEAHTIGRLGYKLFHEKAFQQCSPACHSGCYHGAMESLLNEKGTANLGRDIEQVCSAFDTTFGVFECLHGVGHGALAYADYDMPEGLKECQKLNTDFARSSCYGGLFMENILTGQGLGASEKQTHETKWVNRTDFHFPCNAISQDLAIQTQCYLMQTSWMLTLSKYDFKPVSEACRAAPENLISTCYKSFGRDASGHTLRNPDKIIEICNLVPREKDYFEQCAIGAVNVVIDFWGPGLKNQAVELCEKFEEPAKKACNDTLAYRMKDVFEKNEGAKNLIVSPESQAAPPSDTEAVLRARIEITKDGFVPKKVTVRTGGIVEFTNKDTELHWPASNIHPSHAIYPEFDPKGPVNPGETWSFTFTRKGEWRFHDHLESDKTGLVIVID